MTKRKERYCPKCKSSVPMMRAGFALRCGGKEKQQWKCRTKKCSYITVYPLTKAPK